MKKTKWTTAEIEGDKEDEEVDTQIEDDKGMDGEMRRDEIISLSVKASNELVGAELEIQIEESTRSAYHAYIIYISYHIISWYF